MKLIKKVGQLQLLKELDTCYKVPNKFNYLWFLIRSLEISTEDIAELKELDSKHAHDVIAVQVEYLSEIEKEINRLDKKNKKEIDKNDTK